MAGSVYEGKTFEEAVRRGLEALRLSRAEAVITTIEEGKGGFLGFGSRPFRVSVARRPGGAIREPAEREGRERGGRSREGSGRRGGRDERGGREARGRGGRTRPEEGPAAHGRGARDEREGREERGGRERGGRREERPAREERRPREEGAAREERAARPERSGRGERGGREVPRREPVPVAATSPAPPSDSAAGEGDEMRKRRRRGRRGGRGRRRGGEPGKAGDFLPAEPRAEATAARTVAEPATAMTHAETATPPVRFTSTPPAMPEAPVEISAVHTPEAVPATPVARAPEAAEEAPERRTPFVAAAPAPRAEADGSAAPGAPDMSGSELVTVSRKLTEEMLRAMGFEARVEARAEGNRVDVLVEVERDGELLVGRQGETRQALQHLLNRFLNRGDGSRYHLQLEVNDYWQRREAELEQLARKLAEDAVSQNAEMVTDYLNSQERRILHVTLRGDGRVRTFSLGSGMVKRVAIAPASFPERSED
jgi:predicted RNA-binding protein Jag